MSESDAPTTEPRTRPGDGLRFVLLTGFGTGCAPFMPGTFGTLPGVLIGLSCAIWLDGLGLVLTLAALSVALFWFGAAQTDYLRRRFGTGGGGADGDDTHIDPGAVVLDEIVGYLVALALWIAVSGEPNPEGVVALFVAFRVCDILKPPPIRRLEEFPGAVGVMADDVLAGVYAAPLAGLLAALML